MRPSIVEDLSYPLVLWAKRAPGGELVWLEHWKDEGVCWVMAVSSVPDKPLNLPIPDSEWEATSLTALLEYARGLTGKGAGGPLPCAGVLIDFQRRVWVK